MRSLSVFAILVAIISAGCDKPAQPAPAAAAESPKDMGTVPPVGYPSPSTAGPATPLPPAPVAAEPAYTATTGKTTYTVQKGDGMVGIARKLLGNEHRWKEIRDLNPEIKEPYTLRVGQVIKVPAK